MIQEIVANEGVASICSLLTNKNDTDTKISALTALNNIIRTVEIKEDIKELILSIANKTDNEAMSEIAFELLND